MKFIIDRRKWLRGNSFGCLLSADKTRCCIGFVAKQLGVKDKDCLGLGGIEDILLENDPSRMYLLNVDSNKRQINKFKKLQEILKPLYTKNDTDPYQEPHWLRNAYIINDSTEIDDKTREKKLKEIAKENGHTFVFKN